MRFVKEVCVALTATVCAAIAQADTCEDFSYSRTMRFGEAMARCSLERQMLMFERRKGIYSCEVPFDVNNPFFGEPARQIFVSIVDTNRVCVFFKDFDNRIVSCNELMTGRLSDNCFYWGQDSKGMSAWYGVVGDTMLLVLSPHVKQICLRLDKTSEPIDIGSVMILPSKSSFKGIENPSCDLIERVCQDEAAAKSTRESAHNVCRQLGIGTPVAYYQLDGKSGGYDGVTTYDGRKWESLYMMLTDSGGLYFILGDCEKEFQYSIYSEVYDRPWWYWFKNLKAGETWAVLTNSIGYVACPMELSLSLDACIRHPKYWDSSSPLIAIGGKTQRERLDYDISKTLKKGDDVFVSMKYNRITMSNETQMLRDMILSTVTTAKKEDGDRRNTVAEGSAAQKILPMKLSNMTHIRNHINGGVISQYDYVNDAIGRRTEMSRSGSRMSEQRSIQCRLHKSLPLLIRIRRRHVGAGEPVIWG